nr:hypothetical protein [Tanacetum cinerariifolium]
MVRNVESPSKFLMYPRFLQVMINAQVDDLSSHTAKYTSPALTQKVFANMRRIEDDDDEEQPTYTFESFMTLLNTLMETCATLTQKVAHLEQDIVAQALEITKLKQRVKKLERKSRSKHSGLKRLRKVGGKIAKLDADEDVTLVDVDTAVETDADIQERMEEDVTAVKEINVAELEPTVFDDEEVSMTMAQTLIKMKAEKARIFDEQLAKRMQDKEKEQATAREKKYQNLKRKLISVAQARKNMIVYLKNMAGYKIQHFKGMTYDKVRPVFEREYNSVQTFLKSDRDEEPTKKGAAKETALRKF